MYFQIGAVVMCVWGTLQEPRTRATAVVGSGSVVEYSRVREGVTQVREAGNGVLRPEGGEQAGVVRCGVEGAVTSLD